MRPQARRLIRCSTRRPARSTSSTRRAPPTRPERRSRPRDRVGVRRRRPTREVPPVRARCSTSRRRFRRATSGAPPLSRPEARASERRHRRLSYLRHLVANAGAARDRIGRSLCSDKGHRPQGPGILSRTVARVTPRATQAAKTTSRRAMFRVSSLITARPWPSDAPMTAAPIATALEYQEIEPVRGRRAARAGGRRLRRLAGPVVARTSGAGRQPPRKRSSRRRPSATPAPPVEVSAPAVEPVTARARIVAGAEGHDGRRPARRVHAERQHGDGDVAAARYAVARAGLLQPAHSDAGVPPLRHARDRDRPRRGAVRRRRHRRRDAVVATGDVDDQLPAHRRALDDCQRRDAMNRDGGVQREVFTGSGAGVAHGVGLKLASLGSSRNDVLV